VTKHALFNPVVTLRCYQYQLSAT